MKLADYLTESRDRSAQLGAIANGVERASGDVLATLDVAGAIQDAVTGWLDAHAAEIIAAAAEPRKPPPAAP
jgi:hypothetical protein